MTSEALRPLVDRVPEGWARAKAPPAPPLDEVGASPDAVASARFFAGIARKDLEAAAAVGAQAGVDLPVTDLARQLIDRYFLVP